jgi:SAM-dependent methyltransferase
VKATQRFSNRVDNYVKYRPGYPAEILDLLRSKCGLTADSIVADIGSGTGILTELFLKNGNSVFGVEPNREMREAAERLLQACPKFHSLDGTAEVTGLDNGSIDLITAGQAYHWFDPVATRKEFCRILKPGGWVVLVWNDRRTDSTAFLRDYEQLLQDYGTDYRQVDHKQIDRTALGKFYGAGQFSEQVFENLQHFDFEGLKGRLLSSSYVPENGDPKFGPMLEALEKIFRKYAVKNTVAIEYDTRVFYGQFDR